MHVDSKQVRTEEVPVGARNFVCAGLGCKTAFWRILPDSINLVPFFGTSGPYSELEPTKSAQLRF